MADEIGKPVAVEKLHQRLKRNPLDVDCLRQLAEANSELQVVDREKRHARLARADRALDQGDLETAEIMLRQQLLESPADVDAVRMMAEFARQLGEPNGAEQLLRYAVELAPGDSAIELALAGMVLRQGRLDEGIAILDTLLSNEKCGSEARRMKAAALYQAGRMEESEAIYRELLEQDDNQPGVWTSYGRLLKSAGRGSDSAAAFRRAVALAPTSGVAWWSLSDLKSERLGEADVAAMRAALSHTSRPDDRLHIHFALGKALEDLGHDEGAFESYAEANRIRRKLADYDPSSVTAFVETARQVFTQTFFDARHGGGCFATDPIFILGMTRSGSTLIEQILSSHSRVEGTMELPEMPEIARSIAGNMQEYLQGVAQLSEGSRSKLGEAYIEQTRSRRLSQKPFFTDKMPNNWMHVPLICLALPNARIIDARRHPLGCGWSNFKQHYAKGQLFTYDQREFGLYYRDYVRMMAHIDDVLPGRVHRVFHEAMVDDPEREIRRLLNYLDLPFEQACLEFHKTDRAVMTPSAEQVRRPINRQGVDQWRRFEQWLGSLKEALGPVLDHYPDVPRGI